MTTATNPVLDTIREAFNFDVVKCPLYGPDQMPTGVYGLFRDDNEAFVGGQSVTSRYNPHTTDDVLALAEAASEAFDGAAGVRCDFKDGHRLIIQPSREQRIEAFENDTISPRVMISGNYDGKGFRAAVGMYRDVCRNLHMFREVDGVSVSIRHTSGLRDKMDELIEDFQTIRDGWAGIEQFVERTKNREVMLADFIDNVYGEIPDKEGNARTRYENRTRDLLRRIERERAKLGLPYVEKMSETPISVWECFNAVQGYTQHDATRKGSPNDLARIWMVNNSLAGKTVTKAEKVALELVA